MNPTEKILVLALLTLISAFVCTSVSASTLDATAWDSAQWFLFTFTSIMFRFFLDFITSSKQRRIVYKDNNEMYERVVERFSKAMIFELSQNSLKGNRDGKSGWLQISDKELLSEIYYHNGKLQQALKDNDSDKIFEHTADVANIAMMISDKHYNESSRQWQQVKDQKPEPPTKPYSFSSSFD